MRDLHTNLMPVVGSRPRYAYRQTTRPVRKVIDSLSAPKKDTRRITVTSAEAGLWQMYLDSKEAFKKLWK